MPPERERQRGVRSDEAASMLLPLLLGGVIFTASFLVVLEWSYDQGSAVGPRDSDLVAADADGLADAILAGPGQGWYSTLRCTAGKPDVSKFQPDRIQRLGLGREACTPGDGTRNLSFEKIRNLGGGLLESNATNGKVDYPEARASLGLHEQEFHVRSWPLLPELQETLRSGYRDPYQRAAYIGDYTSLTGGGTPSYEVRRTCGVTDGLTSALVWVDITNNGTTSAAFEVALSLPLADRTVTALLHTPVLAPSASGRASLTLPKSSDWAWAGSATITATVSDVERSLGTCSVSMGGITMTALTKNRLNVASSDAMAFKLSGSSAAAKVRYASYDGRGNGMSLTGRVDLVNSLGVAVATDATLSSRGWEDLTATAVGTYTVRLSSSLGITWNQDSVNVVTNEPSAFLPPGAGSLTILAQSSVKPEVAYVASLIKPFTPNVYSPDYSTVAVPYAAGGDVFPDLKSVMNKDLQGFLMDDRGTPTSTDDVGTLRNYNLLVVGSNVDHSAMTSESAKQSIRDWVLAGGYLMVMGSSEQSVEWLQPLFSVSLSTASQPVRTPDEDHPVLHVPNPLDHGTFEDFGTAWAFGSTARGAFAHIVTSGDNDVLAVSNPGAFGEGRVLLTSWRPYDLHGQGATGDCDPDALTSDCASLRVLHNFLTLGYRDLYLDYGPTVPDDESVGVARRIVTLWHPELESQIEMLVLVYVF